MSTVTINCDIGEAFGIYQMGQDAEIMPYITHANIACGFHASDPSIMDTTVDLAKRHGIQVGAHPGLPDRQGFGRREMQMSRDEVATLVIYQTGALLGFLRKYNVPLSHIKPHGALFGMAQRSEEVAEGIADAAEVFGVPIIAFSDCAMSRVFTRRNIPFVCEFYVDLPYRADGTQIISRVHASVEPNRVNSILINAVTNKSTIAVTGETVSVTADSICVHSDTPNAIVIAQEVHKTLKELELLAS